VGPGHRVTQRYHWEDGLDRGREHWRQFNSEAQAQFLEDLYRFGRWAGDAAEFTLNGTDHGTIAAETLAHIRSGGCRRPAP
jgi:hypothetical protein